MAQDCSLFLILTKTTNKMKQKIVRTHCSEAYSNIVTINSYLEEGWTVLMVNKIGDYLEYVLQKERN